MAEDTIEHRVGSCSGSCDVSCVYAQLPPPAVNLHNYARHQAKGGCGLLKVAPPPKVLISSPPLRPAVKLGKGSTGDGLPKGDHTHLHTHYPASRKLGEEGGGGGVGSYPFPPCAASLQSTWGYVHGYVHACIRSKVR